MLTRRVRAGGALLYDARRSSRHAGGRDALATYRIVRMEELGLQVLLMLFGAALFAGFLDAIAGGGGMVTLPAMLLAGIPPLQVLGTNKLQSLFGSGSASFAYACQGHVDLRAHLPMALAAALGAVLGALLATVVPGELLQLALPFLLIGVAVYFGLKPNPGEVDRQRRMGVVAFSVGFVPVIGFYDGVFGPGTGSFLMLGFIALAGYGLLKATAHTKFLNFGSNLGAFAVFLAFGAVLWKVGLVMGAGQLLGAQLGARFAMRKGARAIKPLLVIVSVTLPVRLLADPAHPLRAWAGL
ncbi:MAG TPA: TSUP family transporter [Pseudoxanthomonas sp.]|nr:TSUP family transporter [Pseudoxanthomonas sp.]